MTTDTNQFFDISEEESVKMVGKTLDLIKKHYPEIELGNVSQEEFFDYLKDYMDKPEVLETIDAVENNLQDYSCELYRIGTDEIIKECIFAEDYYKAIKKVFELVKKYEIHLFKIVGGNDHERRFFVYEFAGGKKA